MRVLVIGASRGIGREFMRQYLADGAQVTATARSSEDAAALSAIGANAFTLDVSDAVSASALAWRVDAAEFDVVILTAGLHGPRSAGLEAPTQLEFDAVMHTNVLGTMRVIPQLSDALAPQAKLAVLSSRMGSIGSRSASSAWLYRASKAALNSVLKDASLELAGKAICIALHPGWVQTDMGGAQADLTPQQSVTDMRRTLASLTPAQTGSFLSYDGSPLAW
jgi:NAD(P)-dependent dehydrogenase (short-subunit alcohol dehydrogenase family)